MEKEQSISNEICAAQEEAEDERVIQGGPIKSPNFKKTESILQVETELL